MRQFFGFRRCRRCSLRALLHAHNERVLLVHQIKDDGDNNKNRCICAVPFPGLLVHVARLMAMQKRDVKQ